MPHWKLTLCYDGSGFHGWQVQPGLRTVQGILAAALERITGETVLPQGAGRTDAGVHALAQVASMTLATEIPAANLQHALNRLMPPSVRVTAVQEVADDFHARHSSRRKTYEYRIFERRPTGERDDHPLKRNDPAERDDPAEMDRSEAGDRRNARLCSPFLAPFVWDCRWPLCFEHLQRAADMVLGTRDFSAMAAAGREPREAQHAAQPLLQTRPNPVKTIYSSAWTRRDGLLVYQVCGSGFLHHMVRNLVGTMADIGRGSLKLEALPEIFLSRNRALAGPTAPASGLFLVGVDYESLPGIPPGAVFAESESVGAAV